MSYNKLTLKQGITLHNINTAKFKQIFVLYF
jgi:hypothetical protein